MKRHLIPVVAILLLVSCGGNPAPQPDPTVGLSVQARAAYRATRVIKALDLVRDIAVAAEAQTPKLMSTASTRKVVDYHESLVRSIQAVPDGWVAVARQATEELKRQIPPNEWQQIEPYVNLAVTLFAEAQK